MNKFLYSILLVFSSFSVYAQSKDSIGEIQTLVQRVDSLEHELSYLKLIYELKTLNSDIAMLKYEIDIKSNSIQLLIYNENFDAELYESFQEYYEFSQRQKEAFFELINATKESFTMRIITYHFTEKEMNILMSNYEVIGLAYNSLESSMNVLKFVIETYGKFL